MTLIPSHVANEVLHFYSASEGYAPGGFVAALLLAAARADRGNRARLSRGFPEYVAAMEIAMYESDGLDQLRGVARSEAGS